MVKHSEYVHDYVQLVFYDDSVFNIYNRFMLIHTDTQAMNELVGKVVLAINTTADAIEITFSGSIVLKIGLYPSDFNGPEAAQFNSPDGKCVIWN